MSSSSSAYTLQLPYLGSIPLGKSPPNLASFQKPLRELYIPYYRQRRDRHPDERRIIISDRDILIFEPDAASKGKRTLIYSTLEAIVDVQALELYLMFNPLDNHHHHKRVRAAFLPIGCEQQERFRSLYSTIDKSQYNLLSIPSSTSASCHPPLVLFVIRKPGTGGTCSLLDCHVFTVPRESVAFELCDMIRKLIIKRTMSPLLPTSSSHAGTTLLRIHENERGTPMGTRTKYLDRDRPISAMEHRQAEIPNVTERRNTRPLSSENMENFAQSLTNGLTNPLTSSHPMAKNNNNHHDPSKVLAMDSDHHRTSSPGSNTSIRTLSTKNRQQQQQLQQRHFIKASSSSSSLVFDESDEVVNDLMNIVVAEKLKTTDPNPAQVPVKRHASFDQNSSSNGSHDNSMTKKRYQFHQHQKKRSYLINPSPLPTIVSANNTPVISRTTTTVEEPKPLAPIDNHLLRPQFVLHRYGDIGNYVPKLLRENVTTTPTTMRSSDSNENIFFRATNGHILNGFLNLDFSTSTAPSTAVNGHNYNNNNNNNHYRSSPCLNDDVNDRNIFSLVRQLRKNQTKSTLVEKDASSLHSDSSLSTCRIPRAQLESQPSKPTIAAMGGVKVLPLVPPTLLHSSSSSQNQSKMSSLVKPRRVASFTVVNSELPVDYRQYLRHTDQADFLYGEEQHRHHQQPHEYRHQLQSTLEHSLGYFP